MKFIVSIFFVSLSIFFVSCKKYLDQKPQKALVVPSTLNDVQAMLDANYTINSNRGTCLEVVADNYYATTAYWQSAQPYDRSSYVWEKDPNTITDLNNWRFAYQGPIYYANEALDILSGISPNNPIDISTWNSLEGTALFYRAFNFYQLAQVFCKPYNASTATSDMGIVLKRKADINESIKRSSVQETYDQIITDLKTAESLLPITSTFPTRPTKAAAEGELARVYLSMRDYSNAGNYANLALKQKGTLMDYNTITGGFPLFNAEVIYFNVPFQSGFLLNAFIDSTLYNSYDNNDLRKTLFFVSSGGGIKFQGSYQGQSRNFLFDGITTDEMYLTRAECYARAGNKDSAVADLNTLMVKRWKNNGTWVPFTALDVNDAKNKILIERRKELIYRCQRWSDLRRLNLEGANITLIRVVNGITYTLAPNDPAWVMLIPIEEINLSGIQQNPR